MHIKNAILLLKQSADRDDPFADRSIRAAIIWLAWADLHAFELTEVEADALQSAKRRADAARQIVARLTDEMRYPAPIAAVLTDVIEDDGLTDHDLRAEDDGSRSNRLPTLRP